MVKIGQNFSRTDWLKAAESDGEVRLRSGKNGSPELYNEPLQGEAKLQSRMDATNELRAFLGKFGDKALMHAGIVPSKAIGGR